MVHCPCFAWMLGIFRWSALKSTCSLAPFLGITDRAEQTLKIILIIKMAGWNFVPGLLHILHQVCKHEKM